MLLGAMDLWLVPIPATLALAVVATLGYLVGRRRRTPADELAIRSRGELRRAHTVAQELEKIAWVIRRNLSRHHHSLTKFKERVDRLSAEQQEAAWKDLCREAAEVLTPTLRLAGQLATAYDEIRQQTHQLTTSAESRTDPLTGVSNRRGLEESLAAQLALMARYEVGFSVVVLDLDYFKHVNDQRGQFQGDRILRQVARLLDESIRETDVVARYGGEEFAVLLPRTDLHGACVFGERLRTRLQQELELTVSGGVTTAIDGDTPESIMARAQDALHRAKAAGRNCIFRHDGERIEPVPESFACPAGVP